MDIFYLIIISFFFFLTKFSRRRWCRVSRSGVLPPGRVLVSSVTAAHNAILLSIGHRQITVIFSHRNLSSLHIYPSTIDLIVLLYIIIIIHYIICAYLSSFEPMPITRVLKYLNCKIINNT